MLTATLLLLLNTAPDVSLADGGPRRIRLIAAPPAPAFEGWTNAQLSTERDRLELARPGVFLPIILIAGGGGLGVISAMGLGIGLTSFFGLAVAVTVGLAVLTVLGLGSLVLGIVLLMRDTPDRREMGRQMDAIDRELDDRRERRRDGPRPPPRQLEPSGVPLQVLLTF